MNNYKKRLTKGCNRVSKESKNQFITYKILHQSRSIKLDSKNDDKIECLLKTYEKVYNY